MNIEHRIRVVFSCLICVALFLTQAVASLEAQEEGSGQLKFSGSISGDGLRMVTSVEVSGDGKFLYASAWRAATITVFRREAMSGELTQVQELTDYGNLQGATAVRLSPDGRFAVSSAFRSKTAVLYRRDPQDGKLTQLDVARNNIAGVTGLQWAIDASFSPDSKFVYIIDSRGPGQEAAVSVGHVTAFRITDEGKLVFVEANVGRDSCFANARGIAVNPDGKSIAVVSSEAATLVVLNRHVGTGKTTIRQVIEDEQDEVHGLDGAMGVAMSPDGQFVYVSSGRFRGDDAIGVYQFNEMGHLSLVQELVNDAGELKNFVGGNEITVSPDGRNVYAAASRSGSLACFQRDGKTGKLDFLETISDEEGRLRAAAGICLSPDGEFVYVAAEPSRMISVFRRTTKRD
ncbi:MAG: beta-propeller fold lactonase family protein [Pirellulaceae bacterium]